MIENTQTHIHSVYIPHHHTCWALICSTPKVETLKAFKCPGFTQREMQRNLGCLSLTLASTLLHFSVNFSLGEGKLANSIKDPYSGYYQCKVAFMKRH